MINEANIEYIESENGVEIVKRVVNDEEYYFVMNHTQEVKVFEGIIFKAYESKILKK
ncbi:Beta-galactosidase C-terminal domain [Clostridium neonatale]|uniref:Beta-galactosidase C-terminal domain n=1 Tax=Clostridium neonatale TaxID=137838 RepID=UPI00313FE669